MRARRRCRSRGPSCSRSRWRGILWHDRISTGPRAVPDAGRRIDPFTTRGSDLAPAQLAELADDVSTDEMCPAYACYFFDERLARYCLVGFRGQVVARGIGGGGWFHGAGGWRALRLRQLARDGALRPARCRHPPGRRQEFFEIYRQNCHNLGLFTARSSRCSSGSRVAVSRPGTSSLAVSTA